MIKIKLIENGKTPSKANPSDAGFDCYARDVEIIYKGKKKPKIDYIRYRLGFQMEMPENVCAFIFPRSSIFRHDLVLTNHVGVIDSGYRGEIMAIFKPTKKKNPHIYEVGDRVCQMIFYYLPQVDINVVDNLDTENDRGGGFGSTGR